jgi:hypothetical protein
MKELLELLKSRAIVGGNGYITNFALLVVAAVALVAVVKAPAVLVGGSITGAAWKVGKMIFKRGTP